MHDAPHARGAAGCGQLARQLDMHVVEGLLVAVQDRHQVDDRVGTPHEPVQLGLVMHIGAHQLHRR